MLAMLIDNADSGIMDNKRHDTIPIFYLYLNLSFIRGIFDRVFNETND